MGQPNVALNLLTPNFPQVSKQPSEPNRTDFASVKLDERVSPRIHKVANLSAPKPIDNRRQPHRGALIVLLMMIAALPSLVFGTLLCLGLVKIDFPNTLALIDSAGPVVRSASVAGGPLLPQGLSSPSMVSPKVLVVPDVLEARVGEATPLELALGGTAMLPERSVISIRGLPTGTMLSSGRPYGDEDWSLTLAEVDGLEVLLPETAEGETQLGIELLSPGGENIASAETLLRVLPARDAGATSDIHAEENASRLGAGEGVRPFVRHGPDDLGYDLALTAQASMPLSAASAKDGKGSPSEAANDEASENPPAKSQDDDPNAWVVLSAFVNLRGGPSSSHRIIGVLDKGKKLRVVRRQRNWIEVTDPDSAQRGWIYARYAYSATRSRQAMGKPGPSLLSSSTSGQEAEPAFWARLGSWISGR